MENNTHVNDDKEFESKLISIPINLRDPIIMDLIFEAIPGTPGNLCENSFTVSLQIRFDINL